MKIITDKEGELFEVYFNVADEIYESFNRTLKKNAAGYLPLTLDDLDPKWVAKAREAADHFGLSWPPYLPEAEEYSLDHPELRNG